MNEGFLHAFSKMAASLSSCINVKNVIGMK